MIDRKVLVLGDQETERRLWKTLDSISDRLHTIEKQLSEVVRLQERVNHHEASLERFSILIDSHGERIRKAEMWQAHHGKTNYDDRTIDGLISSIKKVDGRLSELENSGNIEKGQKDIVKEFFKWASAILAAVLTYKITRG